MYLTVKWKRLMKTSLNERGFLWGNDSSVICFNTVRFFYMQGVPDLNNLPSQVQEISKNGGFGNPGNQNLSIWVGSHCSVVSSTLWSSNPDNNSPFPDGRFPPPGEGRFGMQLFDCASQN
jgi:hypothetical protein